MVNCYSNGHSTTGVVEREIKPILWALLLFSKILENKFS